jgi:hypothetical protein
LVFTFVFALTLALAFGARFGVGFALAFFAPMAPTLARFRSVRRSLRELELPRSQQHRHPTTCRVPSVPGNDCLPACRFCYKPTVQRLFCLALVVLSACKGRAVPAPSVGSAAPDPWAAHGSAVGSGSAALSGSAGSAAWSGSAEPIPKWANDPPDVLRDKINGVNAHVIVLKSTRPFSEYRDLLAVVEKTPGVVAAEPFIFAELYISSASHAQVSLALKAVDPKRVERVLALAANMKVGKVASLASGAPPSIILGDELATRLAVKVGDQVTLTASPESEFEPKVFRVTGTFHVGFDEYDDRLGYASLSAVQAMLGRGDQVLGIELTVKDVDKSGEVAKAIESAIGGPPYEVMDWYELNRNLFTAMYGQRRP